jgi:hypothetical protein
LHAKFPLGSLQRGHVSIGGIQVLLKKILLSVHAGTERSIRLGAVMWRIAGAAIALNGVIRL